MKVILYQKYERKRSLQCGVFLFDLPQFVSMDFVLMNLYQLTGFFMMVILSAKELKEQYQNY